MSFYKVPLSPGKTPLKGYDLGIRMQPLVEQAPAVEMFPGLPDVNPPVVERLEWVTVDGTVVDGDTAHYNHSFDGSGTTEYNRTLMIGRIVGKFPNDMIWADVDYWGVHPQYDCSVLMEWIANPLGSSPGDSVGAMNTTGEWSLSSCPVSVFTTGPYFLISIPMYENNGSSWLGEIRITVTCPGSDTLTMIYLIPGI